MNIYVGNLSYTLTENELRDVFSEYGEVASANIIVDKYSGKSRGFGFVDMPNEADAEQAIEALNGSQLDGRSLKVNEARPRSNDRSERPRGGAGGGRPPRNNFRY
ncbi:RNP-1 like RNA-binding protein [Chloroherpeton thalassium ATCC 35110]|uniref:RNP-1 like RNA-binding protein n=1 Tax=Chloroherpeton thalassium (strain ATCC 35110 / GB-78) TaxID=517418 RepID=B3QSL0_CHLT3|nr:RNA-binding protein [Chloroherpeton thalassium]ACF14057.1 RNP-1 like RNA-binding protein [Chloroherpeton thalassium ATCC 35110]